MTTTSVAAAAEESWITPRHPNPDNTALSPNCTAVRGQWQSEEEHSRVALFGFLVLFVEYDTSYLYSIISSVSLFFLKQVQAHL